VCEGFLDARTCAWLIERAAPLQRQSLVYDPYTGKPAPSDARSNSVGSFTIASLDLVTIFVRERIAATMGVPVAQLERVSVFRYGVGQTFANHYDFLEPSPQLDAEIARRGQRPLTFLVYLNDAFEGGETHFIKLDRKMRVGVGDALFFYNVDEAGAPDTRTEHAGAPPTRGEKWLLSQFIRDKDQLLG
jgi:prolyl 4-hydroxylase